MKKIFSIVLIISLFFCLSFSTFATGFENAFDFEPYEMDYQVFKPGDFNTLLTTSRLTIKSIFNLWLHVGGSFISLFLIRWIFADFFEWVKVQEGVNKRKFNRKVNLADFNQNFDDIVDDKVRGMIVSKAAQKKFRQLFPKADLEEKLYQKQLSYEAEVAWQEANPDKVIDSMIRRRALGAQAGIDYSREYGDLDVAARVQSRIRSMEAQEQVISQNPNTILSQDVQRCQRSAIAYNAWLAQHHKTAIEKGVAQRELSALSASAWRERFPDTDILQGVERRQSSALSELEWRQRYPDTVVDLYFSRRDLPEADLSEFGLPGYSTEKTGGSSGPTTSIGSTGAKACGSSSYKSKVMSKSFRKKTKRKIKYDPSEPGYLEESPFSEALIDAFENGIGKDRESGESGK